MHEGHGKALWPQLSQSAFRIGHRAGAYHHPELRENNVVPVCSAQLGCVPLHPCYCSKIKTAGFGSLNETTTNFDGETTYAVALPPDPEVIDMVPLPLVGDEDMEYVALTATPELHPFVAPISSMPVRLPVGLAPSAVNSPEKITTPTVAGVVVEPAYLPCTALFVNEPAAWGSPNPEKVELTKKA
jgi:hypothetical protein